MPIISNDFIPRSPKILLINGLINGFSGSREFWVVFKGIYARGLGASAAGEILADWHRALKERGEVHLGLRSFLGWSL